MFAVNEENQKKECENIKNNKKFGKSEDNPEKSIKNLLIGKHFAKKIMIHKI